MNFIKQYIIILLLLIVKQSISQTIDSLYTIIQNDTLLVYDVYEVNRMFSPIIDYSVENNIITIVEHDTSKLWVTGVTLKTFCIPITGLIDGHYIINIYHQYDFNYYVPDSLYFRGSIEVDFTKSYIDHINRMGVNYILFTCYPNPFNSSTNIYFKLLKSSYVKLEIFDLLGNEIITLVEDYQHAGEYKIPWNVSELPSGIYLCRLICSKLFH